MNRKIIIFLFIIFITYPLIIFIYSFFCSDEIDIKKSFEPEGIFGKDEFGRDFACVIGKGMRTSIYIAGISSIISSTIGAIMGFISNIKIFENIVLQLIEFFQSFPSLIFVILIVSIFGGGDLNIIISLCIFGWTPFARISRGEIRRIMSEDFFLSAIAIGVGKTRIIMKYILPFLLPPIKTQLSFSFASFILAEGGLGFLGLRQGKTSLGGIIAENMDYILTYPHLLILPGIAISSISIAFTLLTTKQK